MGTYKTQWKDRMKVWRTNISRQMLLRAEKTTVSPSFIEPDSSGRWGRMMEEERRVRWRTRRKRRKGRLGWDISENRCKYRERERRGSQTLNYAWKQEKKAKQNNRISRTWTKIVLDFVSEVQTNYSARKTHKMFSFVWLASMNFIYQIPILLVYKLYFVSTDFRFFIYIYT